MSEHTIKAFDEELNKLKFRLIKMGGLVQEQVEFAVKSYASNNKELAEIIIEREEKVDKIDIKIDKQCLRIFAQHQPYANDLRLVMSALSINNDMEMIGDTTVDIAKEVLKIQVPVSDVISKTKLIEMGELVSKLINNVLDSFVYNNVSIAYDVIKEALAVGSLRTENFDILVAMMIDNNRVIPICSHFIDIIRNLHFISDMAVSIAREIQFLIEAKIVKHSQDSMLGNLEEHEGQEQ